MDLSRSLSPTHWHYWRIVLALAAKDIVDAVKNRTTLTIIMGLALMMLTVEALPLLLQLDHRPRLAIHDADRSSAADELRRQGGVQVLEMRRAEDALNAPREASGPLLALTLPAGWSEQNGVLILDGYLAHWVRPGTAAATIAAGEQALSDLTGRPVTIRTTTVYPTPDSGGHTIMVALGLVLATLLITTILVPHLILEEKKTHTLNLLRVSPASLSQVLLGKGLAGIVYGLAAAGVLLLFNLSLVNLWGVLLPALLGTILLGVGLGLLVGSLVQNEGALQGWVAGLAMAIMVPLFLGFVDSSGLPAWLQQLRRWLPTTAAYDLLRLSFGQNATLATVWPRLVTILLSVAAAFGAAGWRLRAWEG